MHSAYCTGKFAKVSIFLRKFRILYFVLIVVNFFSVALTVVFRKEKTHSKAHIQNRGKIKQKKINNKAINVAEKAFYCMYIIDCGQRPKPPLHGYVIMPNFRTTFNNISPVFGWQASCSLFCSTLNSIHILLVRFASLFFVNLVSFGLAIHRFSIPMLSSVLFEATLISGAQMGPYSSLWSQSSLSSSSSPDWQNWRKVPFRLDSLISFDAIF